MTGSPFCGCTFQVGLTKMPWGIEDAQIWKQLSLEAEKYNDIIIGPYLDGRLVRKLVILFTHVLRSSYLCVGRGKGKAMTQETIYLLWWSSLHLSYADHVLKVGWVRRCHAFPMSFLCRLNIVLLLLITHCHLSWAVLCLRLLRVVQVPPTLCYVAILITHLHMLAS